MRLAALMMVCAAVVVAQDPEPKDIKARELKIKNLRIEGTEAGKVKPTKIANAEELAKAVSNKETQDAIKKEVDFTKEYVLLFTWGGSGGDKLDFKVEGTEAVFSVKRGLTRDLRRHVKLYAIPAKMTHKMGSDS